jgi:hypothetical protein
MFKNPDSTQIGAASSPPNGSTFAPNSKFASRPLLNVSDPLMAYKAALAVLTSLTMCENATGNFGFNTTKVCPSSTATATIPSNTSTPANTLTVLPATLSTTLTSQFSDAAATTSTQVIVLSLFTSSDGGILTETITSASTTSTKASTTSVNSTNATTSTSAACARRPPPPLRALFWLDWMNPKTRDQVLRGFGDRVHAEKSKAFLGAEHAMSNALTTVATSPVAKITARSLTATKAAAAAAVFLSTTSLLGLAVLISLVC